MDDEKKEQGGFKVTDRRQFTTEGDIREESPPDPDEQETPPQEEEPAKESQEEEPQSEAAPGDDQKEEAKRDPGQGVNFASFLLSLATTGMVHLGEIPEPGSGQKMEDLEAAQQMIDILDILKQKTEGNLSAEEAHLMENVLYELRMKFMGKSKAIKL